MYGTSGEAEMFPLPGEINRLPMVFEDGVYGNTHRSNVPKLGDNDNTINISGWLHSYMIGANFYDVSLLVSSNEANPIVVIKGDQKNRSWELPYDYTVVSTAEDSYWDPLFSGDITGQGRAEGTIEGGVAGVCHVSYANMALCGERLKYWKSGDHRRVIMSSRAPENGANTGDDFTKSPTLLLYGDATKWEGIYVTADGATHYATSMFFDGVTYTPQGTSTPIQDGAFSAEFTDYENTDSLGNLGGASSDTWMVLNVASTETDVTTAWDELLP